MCQILKVVHDLFAHTSMHNIVCMQEISGNILWNTIIPTIIYLNKIMWARVLFQKKIKNLNFDTRS